LAIKSIETGETLERWQFEIHTDEAAAAGGKPSTLVGKTASGGKKKEKTEKEVQAEIREIMKQITSTTTFLPILQEECKSIFVFIPFQALPLCLLREEIYDVFPLLGVSD
jgi:mitotic spindle assembly checkpoint protein MAD2